MEKVDRDFAFEHIFGGISHLAAWEEDKGLEILIETLRQQAVYIQQEIEKRYE